MKELAQNVAAPMSPAHAGSTQVRVWGLSLVVLALWAAVPIFASRSAVDMLVFSGLYTIAGLGVTFLLGQCGIVSLAQSVFYGIGAYSTAYCATHFGWPAPAGFAI